MRTVFFLLLRLICYPALAILVAAGLALIVVKVNGQCPPLTEIGVTCVTRLSQRWRTLALPSACSRSNTGAPIVLAVGGLILLFRDVRRGRA